MLDVLIAGAGPAGSIAALRLARAGARVLLVDREQFPRDKLCGDTLNPGAVRLLHSLDLHPEQLAGARPFAGIRLTGPNGDVTARYPRGQAGVAITRAVLDAWLLDQAVRAGAHFEPGVTVRGPLYEHTPRGPIVRGAILSRRGGGGDVRMPALMTLAADGRRSTLARTAGLVRRTRAPRRWAYGVYAESVTGLGDLGEMHIRHGWYFGIAPLASGRVNLCVVRSGGGPAPAPDQVIRGALDREPAIAARFERAVFDAPVRVLGPLAADVGAPGVRGMVLAGDASGFVDPLTGDGMWLAMRGSLLAADAIADALEHGDLTGAVLRLWADRRRVLGPRLRFNRLVRRLVDSRAALDAAGFGSRILPAAVRAAVRYAGDAA